MKNALLLSLLLLIPALTLGACGGSVPSAQSGTGSHDDHGGTAAEAATTDTEKGPHNGRLLRDGEFAIELAIVEDGVPPEYRAWITKGGKPVPPEDVTLTVELARLDGEVNRFRFTPEGDFLRGDGVVTEPHSFDVSVTAEHAGTTLRWAYESYKGRVQITDASAKAAGIVTAQAGPRRIHDVLPLYGRLEPRPEAIREIGARYPGTIESVSKTVGDTVQAGEVLARIESSDSLQRYAVRAPISGTITARLANPGEEVGREALFMVSDLSTLWAELLVFPRDLARIALGQELRLKAVDSEQEAGGRIARIAPAADPANGAIKVWASIDAGEPAWAPGQFVNADVLAGGAEVPLAVRASGLQAFRDFTVVFAKVGETYEVRMLELGRSDGDYVEVLGGLKPGTEYVIENSFLIKADIEKSGASHDH